MAQDTADAAQKATDALKAFGLKVRRKIMVLAGISFIFISFIIGIISCCVPLGGTLLLIRALSQGIIGMWMVYTLAALPFIGDIVAIIGFVVRKKGGNQLKEANLGVKALALFLNYFGIAANVIGFLYNTGFIVAFFVLREKLMNMIPGL
jgi:hypothetical protein